MKTLTFILVAFWGFLAQGKPLLVVIDEITARQPYIANWRAAVEREGNFEIAWWVIVQPTAWSKEPERTDQVRQIMSWVAAWRPAAVQIIGQVAMPATGQGVPDGHIENASVLWSDLPIAFANQPNSDARDLVTNGLPSQLNRKNDGRFDVTYYTGKAPLCPVARVSFDGMNGLATQPFTNACYSGPPVPPVDEAKALSDYFARNLAYRSGRARIDNQTVWCQRAYHEISRDTYFKTNLTWLPWVDWPKETINPELRSRFLFVGNMPEAYWWALDPLTCETTRTLWVINFRSNAWERYGYRQGLPRFLLFGPLVSVWGMDFWRFNRDSVTVADDIWWSWTRPQREPQSQVGITGMHALSTVMGDLTLPNNQPVLAEPTPVTGLRIIR